jgi:hypothetical protein
MKLISLFPLKRYVTFGHRYSTLIISVCCLLSFSATNFSQERTISKSSKKTTTNSRLEKLEKASDRQLDGLVGPVRTVRTEVMLATEKEGQPNQGRILVDVATYDLKGKKINAESYPNPYAVSSSAGKESYKYDGKGNLTEMTVFGPDGSILHRETYTYEFDAIGNWIKMTTSVAAYEDGKIKTEPSEYTYRTISYYLNAKMLSVMADKAASPNTNPNTGKPQPNTTPKGKGTTEPIVIKKQDIKASSPY